MEATLLGCFQNFSIYFNGIPCKREIHAIAKGRLLKDFFDTAYLRRDMRNFEVIIAKLPTGNKKELSRKQALSGQLYSS